MKKIKLLFAIFTTVCIVSNAQTNIGIDYFRLGEYDLAKKYFEAHLSQTPAESNYYLGEIAFAQNKKDEAKSYYTKGLNANKEYPLNAIGLAKLELKQNLKAAESVFKRYNQKIDALIEIGYAYLDNGFNDIALEKAEEAQKLDRKDPRSYVLEGDALKSSKNLGAAVGKYDNAIYYAPNYPLPYIKGSEIYENTNWQVAIEKLKTIAKLEPGYLITYRNLGKLYTANGFYPLAVEAYKTYFSGNYYTLEDISRYVTALYFNKQYEEIVEVIKEGLAIDPNHFVLNRLQLYAAAGLHDHTNGLKHADSFFTLNDKSDSYISKDYAMYATLLKDAKLYDKATAQYEKALLMDSANYDLYKEMANVAGLKGENAYAAELYKLYISKIGDKIEASDYYQLGRYYYNAGSIRSAADTTVLIGMQSDKDFIAKLSENGQAKDSLLKNNRLFIKTSVNYFLSRADSAFDIVIERVPDGYTGYLWKARTNSLLDPDSEIGLAKPYYEKTIDILLTKKETTNAITSTLIEAYSYLGYFYYLKNDSDNTLLYWNKVLELDPQNSNANAVLKTMKKK